MLASPRTRRQSGTEDTYLNPRISARSDDSLPSLRFVRACLARGFGSPALNEMRGAAGRASVSASTAAASLAVAPGWVLAVLSVEDLRAAAQVSQPHRAALE